MIPTLLLLCGSLAIGELAYLLYVRGQAAKSKNTTPDGVSANRTLSG